MQVHEPEYLNIVSDQEVEKHHLGHFGTQSNREVLDEAALKVASGYWPGGTAQQILKNHNLMFEEKGELILTKKGREYLYRRVKHIFEVAVHVIN